MNSANTLSARPAGIRVVEASAGSGKTYALAKRYVQTLLDPRLSPDQVPMRNILAITFTNKAAYAMKGRILEFLKKISLGTFSAEQEKEILTPIGLTAAEARPRALKIMNELIHNYNFFQVQTIDSFINALLSGCAFKIGLSAGFKIKRNYTEYLEYSLDRLIERAASDKLAFTVMSRFLQQYLFLENKPGWFPKKDMLDLQKALYNQSNTYGRDFEIFHLAGDDLSLRKKKIMAAMRSLREGLPPETNKTFLKSLDKFLEEYQDGFDFDRLSDFFSREEVPVNKGVKVSRDLARQWDKINKQLRELAEAEAYSLFNPYVEVFEQINVEFRHKAAEEDVLFLPELNRRARQLFDEGMVTVEELYYRLATRFHHYLLDEFQDTSRLQWQNLSLMIEEALATGGTFFYVGDKKQAIYGFRGGEAKLFDEVKDGFTHFGVSHEQLSINYRSQKTVVDFNNNVFSRENLDRFILALAEESKERDVALSPADVDEIRNIFHASRQTGVEGKDKGYVKVEYVESKSKDDRNEEIRQRVLGLIKELRTRFNYGQIAVLTRNNAEIEEVTGWLMREGIFVESERTLNIKENSLVRELMAFLKFLDSPIDNLSFALFISGEIFSKATGISQDRIHAFLFSLRGRQEREKDFFIYKAFQERFPKVWEQYFEEFFRNVGLFPLYELCSSILRRFAAFENFTHDQGFLLRFLELVTEKEEEHTDLGSFLEVFEDLEADELFVNVVNSDAIKVLTVHKAKGLEFPVVIIPFLGIKVHGSTGGEKGQQSYVLDMGDDKMRLLRIKAKYLKFSEKLSEIHRLQEVSSFISELNNIYVALTRSQYELYAFIPSRVGQNRNLAKHLFTDDLLIKGKQGTYPATDTAKKQGQLGLPACGEHDWIEFLKEEFTDTDRVFDREQARRGEVLHAALAELGNLAGRKKVSHAISDKVRAQFPQFKAWGACDEALRQLLQAPALKDIFYVPDGEVSVEKDIVDPSGKTKRIDRLIVKKDEVWVVDFKTSREGHDKHAKQIAEYKTLVAELYPGRKANGFLVYMHECGIERID